MTNYPRRFVGRFVAAFVLAVRCWLLLVCLAGLLVCCCWSVVGDGVGVGWLALMVVSLLHCRCRHCCRCCCCRRVGAADDGGVGVAVSDGIAAVVVAAAAVGVVGVVDVRGGAVVVLVAVGGG